MNEICNRFLFFCKNFEVLEEYISSEVEFMHANIQQLQRSCKLERSEYQYVNNNFPDVLESPREPGKLARVQISIAYCRIILNIWRVGIWSYFELFVSLKFAAWNQRKLAIKFQCNEILIFVWAVGSVEYFCCQRLFGVTTFPHWAAISLGCKDTLQELLISEEKIKYEMLI